MTQGPWSVKGIDPKARSVARERANRQGVTLGQFLNSLLLDEDPESLGRSDAGGSSPGGASDPDIRRMSQEIDQLSERLDASQARSARAVSGLDKSILGLMGKVDASGKAQLGALERVTRALGEIESTQGALRARIDTLESDARGGPTLSALKTLEASLGRLADTLHERLASVEQAQTDIHNSVDGKVEEIQQQMSAVERRMDGALDRITDAASRFEMFETKAERAVGDTTWRMERALESTLTRSRAMSKELLDRVDSIEEKTREAVTNLSDAVSRITERLTRAERKTETAVSVLERSVSELDDRLDRARPAEEFAQLQSQFQKRLDSLAEDLSRPIHAVRADVERKLEEIMRSGANPEKIEKLERTLRHVQDQIQVSEARQADAVEAMSAQVERMSRAVEDRLRAVETRGDARSIEDVRREMARLADTIDARLGNAETSLRNDIGRLNTSVDDRVKALEQRSASAIDAVGEQVAVVAERLQKRHDESVQKLSKRLDDAAADSRQLDSADLDRLADKLDERVKESERRSATAIGQIGEQVARVADRLQAQHQESLRSFEARLAESGRSHEKRLSEVLGDMTRRMDEIGEHSSASLTPVHKTVSSLARRLEEIEDGPRSKPNASEGHLPDEFVFLEDSPEGQAAQTTAAAGDGEQDVVGVEPPPFDRVQDAHLFEEKPAAGASDASEVEAVNKVEDLLDTDSLVFAGSPAKPEFVADLPRDDARERQAPNFLEEARRAARQGSRAVAAAATTRRGIGKGPLIASAALAVAVAGGGVMTVMRGKQETRGDDFARLDPAAPAAAEAEPGGAEAVLFGDGATSTSDPSSVREPAAGDLFDPAAATKPATAPAKAPAAPETVTLASAVASGDPVALHDYALELLQSGEKQRAVTLLKDAAGRGLVMAEYRLAKLYERGEGVPRDIAASRSWTEKAAIGGNVKAMHDLAVFYAEGDAGPQSYAAAVEWFRQASDLGLVDSQYNLAVLYEQGLGLSQDKAEAAYWFEVAGRAGDQDAARRARTLLSDMPTAQAEQIKRRARAFNPKAAIARANGDFGRRPWDVATPQQVSDIQRLLERLGYGPGAPDGKLNARTELAIREFEKDNELPVTGEASVSLLRLLRAATINSDG